MLVASGCRSVANGDLRFVVIPVPGPRALLAYGPDAIQQPIGNSLLCVGGALTRIPGTFDGARHVSWRLNLNATQHDPISVGSTWYFQSWFRDPAAGGAAYHLLERARGDVHTLNRDVRRCVSC